MYETASVAPPERFVDVRLGDSISGVGMQATRKIQNSGPEIKFSFLHENTLLLLY